MWLHIPFWLPTTISSTSLTQQIALCVFVFLGRLLPAMSQQCQSLPTPFLGIPRLPRCRLLRARGSPRPVFGSGARPGCGTPGRALPGGRGPAPLPHASRPPRGRWRPGGAADAAPPAAGRTRSAPELAGRDRPERCWRRRGTPVRSPCGTHALPARRGLLAAGEAEEEGSAVLAARPGPARRAAGQSEWRRWGRGKLCRPGAMVTGGGGL